MRIALVAAEPSGDQLAAGLMAALRRRLPGVRFEGVGGRAMAEQGLESRFPMEKLSLMGLVEVVRHLPELVALRRGLVRHWRTHPPDLFIGVDAPDFNLGLEQALHAAGVPTVHYVSPTVWAWRQDRVKTLHSAADLVLCIFPFEPGFLQRHGVAARYVGHPLAARYPLEPDRAGARQALSLPEKAPVLALLPGSRMGEVERIAPPFLQAAVRLAQEIPGLRVATPTATEKTEARFRELVQRHAPELDLSIHPGRTAEVLTAADLALVASGTATFEALLCKLPMVVGYRMNPLTYHLITGLGLLKTRQVAMANLLSEKPLAPELLQSRCEPDLLAREALKLWRSPDLRREIEASYHRTHRQLRMETDTLAADAVLELLDGSGSSPPASASSGGGTPFSPSPTGRGSGRGDPTP